MDHSRILLVLALIGGGWFFFMEAGEVDPQKAYSEMATEEGFVPVHMPSGADSGTVHVMTPPNCPSDKAQRARELAEYLDERGIPNRTFSRYRASASGGDSEAIDAMERATDVINQGPPAIFVNGYAKSDPRFRAVQAVYERTQ